MWNLGKIINLLFDTFHNTKYFHAHIYAIACHFCVGCFTGLNPLKIYGMLIGVILYYCKFFRFLYVPEIHVAIVT
jgi:hypothetical protein